MTLLILCGPLLSSGYSFSNLQYEAFFPIVFGIVSDMNGFMRMLYMLVGVQALASLVNLPLIFNPLLRRESTNNSNENIVKDTDRTDETGSVVAKEKELPDALHNDKSLIEGKEDVAGTIGIVVGNGVEDTGCSAGITRRSSSAISC